jgi:tetratricopeptide (TPR) repeat protein
VPRKSGAFETLTDDAAALFEAGRNADAEAAYRAALALSPGHPMVLHNLGVIAASGGDRAAAIEQFGAAIAAEPRYASAHYHRAVAFQALGRHQDAIADFAQAATIDPSHYPSHRALGFSYLAEGERGRALDHFARTYELRRGTDRTGAAAKSLDQANRIKLLHDAEQFRYLAGIRRDRARFEAMARIYEAVACDFPLTPTKLTNADLERLGETFNTAINVRDAPEIVDGATASRPDRKHVVRAFSEGPGALYFDDLLTPSAFASLRRYLLESTIWHDFTHIGGFVASYLEDGLACPLLLQVADELRTNLSELLGDYPLTQAWAFKAVESTASVDIHADDSAVSVNFWMTPAAANLDPGRGGMDICLEPPPPEWRITGYEQDRARSVAFLEQHRHRLLRVPYRENRAVLFRSRLLHFSDRPEFAEGYENHRINITLLFGAGSSESPLP